MFAAITRLLALSQAPFISQSVPSATQDEVHNATTSLVAIRDEMSVRAAGGCNSDRYDPFVCECLGQNGCWAPSVIEEGPPYSHPNPWPKRAKTCTIPASGNPNGDDSPAILKAFRDCKRQSNIIFQNTTYYVGTVMNTTGLDHVNIELRGTLLWSKNIQYWLANSLPIGFQNQTAAWHLGGRYVHFYGHGYGTLNGNGQAWYDYAQGQSNLHGRPHAISFQGCYEAVVEGLRFIKPQMWTVTVAHSEKMLLQDIYINATSDPGRDFRANVNTDGVDTLYANNITFLRWTVDNGDDSISMKQNSTNIYISDCDFYNGQSLAMGSIGQYPGQINIIENITATNIRAHNTGYGGRVKTWTGRNKGTPPNGGGGGLGHAKNITFTDFQLDNVNLAWAISQCTSYNGQKGDCDTSQFKVSNLRWGNARGTLKGDRVATLWCSAAAKCENINLFNNNLRALDQNKQSTSYLCESVGSTSGFTCTGPCNGQCPR